MISNLQSARTLIQADLDHARKVLELWAQQVSDLEHALEQIDTVGESRKALKENYAGSRSAAPRLVSPNASGTTRRGRTPKADVGAAGAGKQQHAKSQGRSSGGVPNSVQDGKARKAKKASKVASPRKAHRLEAKYKDPNSDKTWSGRGRRPGWLVGNADQYRIQPTAVPHEATTSPSVH